MLSWSLMHPICIKRKKSMEELDPFTSVIALGCPLRLHMSDVCLRLFSVCASLSLSQETMGGDMRYEIGQNAYIKLVLQALNHKTSAVNGLLLVRLSAYNNDVVEITESVPLFHSQIDLLPPLEIVLIQDGVITDLQETKDALAMASDLPFSILIVGVGGQILKRWRFVLPSSKVYW